MEMTAPARTTRPGWVSAVVRQIRRHPRPAMAVKAALAAMAAWTAVQPLGGVLDNYAYYAPLGAVVAVSTTVTSSAREAGQSVLAIVLGGSVAILFDALLGRSVVTLGLVVGLGILMGGWRRLGAMSSWVPIAGLFVLILGQANPGHYVAAYAGLTAFGALVGVVVNFLFPPLPLEAADETLDQLRDTLAGQFDELGESLRENRPLGLADWETRSATVRSINAQTSEAIGQAADAQRANWRARRWREQAQRQYDAALSIQQLPFIVEEVTAILVHETSASESLPWGDPLPPRLAAALEATAGFLRSIDSRGAGPEEVQRMDEAVASFADAVRHTRSDSGDDLWGLAALVTTLMRLRNSVEVRED